MLDPQILNHQARRIIRHQDAAPVVANGLKHESWFSELSAASTTALVARRQCNRWVIVFRQHQEHCPRRCGACILAFLFCVIELLMAEDMVHVVLGGKETQLVFD